MSAYLSFLITTKGAPDQPIFSATLTLEFLCTTPPLFLSLFFLSSFADHIGTRHRTRADKANEQGRIVPYTEFYNAAVSERVNLAKEYK
ncbi:hypothetical protein GR268_44485 [Rhizobium leguminosarum]|nr:hypothetical protein [Rhizobium leguminosarum]